MTPLRTFSSCNFWFSSLLKIANVDPEAITSHLTPEGVLVLEAPVNLPAIEDKRRAAIEDRRSSSSPSTVLASNAAHDEDNIALRTDSPSQAAVTTAK